MIIVFGSINMDMLVSVNKMPESGETMICPSFEMAPGGKGANQALAALRGGPKTALVGRAGDDGMGTRIVTSLRREGVITSGIVQSEKPTGCAIVMRDARGGNRIIVASGANADVTSDQVPDEILKPGTIVLAQMETPLEQTLDLLRRAKACGAMTILNLAPVQPIPAAALKTVDILIVNEVEAAQAARQFGLPDAGDVLKIAQGLSKLGGLTCIVTLGDKGAIAWTPEGKPLHVPALKIDQVIDSTGAGDAYCGTLAAALHKGMALEDAMKRASVAGSLSCLKKGAQESFPYEGDIDEKVGSL